MTKKQILILVAVAITTTATVFFGLQFLNTRKPAPEITQEERQLPEFTEDQLKEFDGTDSNKPIYIGYNGRVYDVSTGSKFYNTDGPYHFLAGKDSTKDLQVAGGSIIEKKYPVIGILKNTQ